MKHKRWIWQLPDLSVTARVFLAYILAIILIFTKRYGG